MKVSTNTLKVWSIIAFTGAISVVTASKLEFLSSIKNSLAKAESNSVKNINNQYIKPHDMNHDYTKSWEEIDSLESSGLPESALLKVKELLEIARSERENGHFIKCLIYIAKYTSTLNEDGMEKAIKELEAELEIATFPNRQVLQSILAEMYNRFLDDNLWNLRDRKQVLNQDDSDINTWSIEKLTTRSSELFLSSLQSDSLKLIPIQLYSEIIEKEANQFDLRPTLFDFLSHRAIDYFIDEKSYLTEPAYAFQLSDANAFSTASEFLKWLPVTLDSNSFKIHTINVLKNLIAFHINTGSKGLAALTDVDLKRLRFVHENSTLPDRDKLFQEALSVLRKQCTGTEMEAEVIYELASIYQRLGSEYTPLPFGFETEDSSLKWHFRTAVALCDEAITKYPNSYGGKQCTYLKNEITSKSLDVTAESVYLPSKPVLARIGYKNLSSAWVKVARIDTKTKKRLEELQQSGSGNAPLLEFFRNLKSEVGMKLSLPNDGDFRMHSAEFGIKKLDLGEYILIVSSSKDLDAEGSVSQLLFSVSQIGFWERQGERNNAQFVVFDRNSGQPLAGVKAKFFIRNYNSLDRIYDWIPAEESFTDVNGFVTPDFEPGRSFQYRVVFENKKDKLDTGNSYYFSQQGREPLQNYQQTVFFLDRAIYRPGQTIYFKGIALEYDKERKPVIIRRAPVTVTFRDANYQEVTKLELHSNEYGTFNGSFMAPRTGLTGAMTIHSSIGGQSKSFRVEEYKRPRFEVKFEPLAGSYQLGSQIKVTGKAADYAGSKVDGATVVYKVVREAIFPWRPWWSIGWFPDDARSMQIASGVTRTDDEGHFEIDFEAIPDLTIPKKRNPIFNFSIQADITDAAGETRSAETEISIGYRSIFLDADIAADVKRNELKSIKILSTNPGGQKITAKGTLKLERLRIPQQAFVERYWDRPDKSIMKETEFKKNFPSYAWGNEDNPENWQVDQKMEESSFDTEVSDSFKLKSELEPGWYALHLQTKGNDGEIVEVRKFFHVFDTKSNVLKSNAGIWHYLDKKNFEPDEIVSFYLGTSVKKAWFLLEIEKDGVSLERKWMTISGLHNFDFRITETHRGDLSYCLSSALNNRSTNARSSISVPWTNKELKMEFMTFRDKLYPGQDEQWIIKVKGPKKEKVAAETVAALYDASLDDFAVNNWYFSPFPTYQGRIQYNYNSAFPVSSQQVAYFPYPDYSEIEPRYYPELNWFGWFFYGGRLYARADAMLMAAAPEMELRESVKVKSVANPESDEPLPPPAPEVKSENGPLVRENLNETVFFFPELMTDEEGNIAIKFKMNEALTRWKFLALAHTSDLKLALVQKEVVTQKELMVLPNAPRFFRELDEIEFSAKIVNLTQKDLQGNAQLQLVNPMETIPVYKWQDNPQFNVNFKVAPGKSIGVSWRFKIPEVTEVPLIEYTVLAEAGDFTDAERAVAPVITNRIMVTETMPMPVRGGQTKNFLFQSMSRNNSETLKHERYTLEFTQNPAWHAVQALPYLMEFPYECSEQIFARYYANTLATSVVASHPRIKAVFDKWRNYEPNALMSNLNKNQELKSALIAETPWVLQSKDEEYSKKQIALLFDLNKMSQESETALNKLAERQLIGGGWPWFAGGEDSWYITQYIAEGFGHLLKLGATDFQKNPVHLGMVTEAVKYCDNRVVEEFERLERLVKEGKAKFEDDHLSYLTIHYLYMRSFFLVKQTGSAISGNSMSIALKDKAVVAFDYYLSQAEKFWLTKGLYSNGLLALALHRTGKSTVAKAIVQSLKERAIKQEELGMYWKYPKGYWWYTAPIENQALMIEVFNDVANDRTAVDELRIWLLKNKQTTSWKTTKATSSAVYALLMIGDDWLQENAAYKVSIGSVNDNFSDLNARIAAAQKVAESGTGTFKIIFNGPEVKKEMSSVRVYNPNKVVGWSAAYWQYFENLDKITSFEETPLKLRKLLFKVQTSATGETLVPLQENQALQVGDKIKVRIELRVDREMEFVHMKDMRASGLEPLNVLSTYKWQSGLGYYESTRDASVDFFFSWLPKGTFVFEYPLRVVHKGDFSNGVTTIQSMYAPEFSSHSEGIRIKID
jgi:hypothetical protein